MISLDNNKNNTNYISKDARQSDNPKSSLIKKRHRFVLPFNSAYPEHEQT